MKNLYVYSEKLAKKNKVFMSLPKYFFTYLITLIISTIVFLLFKKVINIVNLNSNLFRCIEGFVLFVIIVFDFLYVLFPSSLKFHSRLKAYYVDKDDIYLISISDLVLIMFETTLFLPRVHKNDKDNNLFKKIKYYIVGILTSFLIFSKIRKNINKMQDKETIMKFVKDPIFYKRSANVYKVIDVNRVSKLKNKTSIRVNLKKLDDNKVFNDNTLVIYNVYNNYDNLINSFKNKVK